MKVTCRRVWRTVEAHTGICWGNLTNRYNEEDPGINWMEIWIGSSWLRIETGGGHL